jgi:serine/threonine protein phosphatase 1
MKVRTLVIGDIHGGFLALEQALEKAAITSDDHLIFLGDYVDGWSQSCSVIEYLIELKNTNNCLFIRGNHDTWCEDWLRRSYADQTWLKHGGSSTIESYGLYEEEKWKRHLQFFESMINFHVDEHNNLFIHAGYSSMHGPEKETYTSNYSWDRTLWEMALTMDKRIQKDSKLYPKRLKLFNEIFIGHTPTLNYDVEEPMNAINIWNIDTGAGFFGKLTVLDINTKEFWQSDVLQTLYPNEKGRNRK